MTIIEALEFSIKKLSNLRITASDSDIVGIPIKEVATLLGQCVDALQAPQGQTTAHESTEEAQDEHPEEKEPENK